MQKKVPLKRPLFLLLLASLLNLYAGCAAVDTAPLIHTKPESSPQWTLAHPVEVGLDETLMRQAITQLPKPIEHGLHSMLIVRHNKLVLEEYWNGYDRDTLQDIRSATKSITSLLTGIAIDKHFLGSTKDPMLDYLAGAYPSIDSAKRNMTLADLLTMRSGLACDDRNMLSPGQEDKMYLTRDWVHHFLELPIATEPGKVARYCTGGVVALGRVISEASKQSIPDFSQQYLFGPLAIENFQWSTFDDGRQIDTGGHLFLRPRDMAKIGLLVLQHGQWNGSQLVSSDWIDQSIKEQTRIDDGQPYGYLWWMAGAVVNGETFRVVYASGNGGQYIFVVPDLDLIAVFTGGNFNSKKANLPFEIFGKYVLPAALLTK